MGKEREFREVVAQWFWNNYALGPSDPLSCRNLITHIRQVIDERTRVYLRLKIIELLRKRGREHLGRSDRAKFYQALIEVVGGRREGVARTTALGIRASFDGYLGAVDVRRMAAVRHLIEHAIDEVSRATLDRLDRDIEEAVERIVSA